MAGLGGFLLGAVEAYGNEQIQGAKMGEQQAQTALLKTEAQRAQLQQQQMQQQMKTQKDIGAFIKSQTDLEGADAALPMNQAKMYGKAAGLAASQGDLASAKEMTELSKRRREKLLQLLLTTRRNNLLVSSLRLWSRLLLRQVLIRLLFRWPALLRSLPGKTSSS